MKHLTGICEWCGKSQEAHGEFEFCPWDGPPKVKYPIFRDSGQAALERHAPELFEAAENINALPTTMYFNGTTSKHCVMVDFHQLQTLKSIIDKIKQP